MTDRPWLRALLLAALLVAPARAGDPPEVVDHLASSREAPLIGVWVGEFRQYDPGRFWSYQMWLEVDEDAEGRVSGTLHWPTLEDSITTFTGTRDGTSLRFTEPELLQGKDIVLDGEYRASFRTPDRLEGIWSYPREPERYGFGTFVLRRTALPRRGRPSQGWMGR